MFCMNCGAENKDEARFCGKCGKPIEVDAPVAIPQIERSPMQGAVGATRSNSKMIAFVAIAALAVIAVIIALSLFAINGCTQSVSMSGSSDGSGIMLGNAGGSAASVKSTVDDYTWDELSTISNEIAQTGNETAAIEVAKRYNLVGADGKLDGSQTKSVTLSDGTQTAVQIAGFYHDDKTSGGKAGITFIFKDAIAEHDMNPGYNNSDGWEASQMRSWLAADGLGMLPRDLSSKIVAVDKKTNNVGETTSISSVTTTSDKLWLFSYVELTGVTTDNVLAAEGSEYKLFNECSVNPNGSNSILTKDSIDGFPFHWWERSPNSNTNNGFLSVLSDGKQSGGTLSKNKLGVVPGFCI